MNPMIKDSSGISLIILFVFTAVCFFIRINERAKEINKVKDDLNNTMGEITIIKFDYLTDVSILYELYRIGDIDNFGKNIKSIVEENHAIAQ